MDNGSFLSSNSTIVLESIHVFCFVSTEFEVGLEWVILILRGHNCSKIFVSMVVSEGGGGRIFILLRPHGSLESSVQLFL